jgi:hypothetical protein
LHDVLVRLHELVGADLARQLEGLVGGVDGDDLGGTDRPQHLDPDVT